MYYSKIKVVNYIKKHYYSKKSRIFLKTKTPNKKPYFFQFNKSKTKKYLSQQTTLYIIKNNATNIF